MKLYNIRADGNCMFSAICVAIYGTQESHKVQKVRMHAVRYIARSFSEFSDTIMTTHGISSQKDYEQKMRQPGVFTDHEEFLALCQFYDICATVFTGFDFQKQQTINEEAIEKFHVHLCLNNEHYDLLTHSPRSGDWVLVQYDSKNRLAQVVEAEPIGWSIKVLNKTKQYWVYPKGHKTIFVASEDIARQIMSPTKIGKRELLLFLYVNFD